MKALLVEKVTGIIEDYKQAVTYYLAKAEKEKELKNFNMESYYLGKARSTQISIQDFQSVLFKIEDIGQ